MAKFTNYLKRQSVTATNIMINRGQFAIEMFFAFTFAILLVFWLVNYVQLFSDTGDRVPIAITQRFIAKDLGRLANDVCAYGGSPDLGNKSMNLIVESPCIQLKKESWPYNISVAEDGYTLLIKSDPVNSTGKFKLSCPLEVNANLTRCTASDRLCIYKGTRIGPPQTFYVKITTDTSECE